MRSGSFSWSVSLGVQSDFSWNTKHDSMADTWCGVMSVNTPLKTSSVSTSSSAALISHATRPLVWMMLFLSTYASLRSTRIMYLSSSFSTADSAPLMDLRSVFMRSRRRSLSSYWTTREASSPELNRLSDRMRNSMDSIFRMSFLKPSSVISMSSTGSSRGGPSGKRESTSFSDFPACWRFSAVRRSFGRKTRTELSCSTAVNDTGMTCISPCLPCAGRNRTRESVSGLGTQGRMTSTTKLEAWLSESGTVSCLFFFFFWKLIAIPHPQSVSWSPSQSRTRSNRPGCRNGSACTG
mmetsp:Transcript_6096/g.15464  ORF Transcript_6096/g.15464 Transcript_6096/m.15464 type:complete len:295 (-) Transcript_6096:273-1157(-)